VTQRITVPVDRREQTPQTPQTTPSDLIPLDLTLRGFIQRPMFLVPAVMGHDSGKAPPVFGFASAVILPPPNW